MLPRSRDSYHRTDVHPDFWEQNPPLAPLSLLGAGTSISSLQISPRYQDIPDHTLASIAEDLQTEDEALEDCIDKGRLELWWQGVLEAAKQSARQESDQAGEKQSRRMSMETRFKARMDKQDKENWVPKDLMNRNAVRTDEQGDVVMGM